MTIQDILEEHAEEAAILWSFRDAATTDPDYDLEDLAELDERLEAHLDGLRIAGIAGWETCKESGWGDAGEFFTAMSLALHGGDPAQVDEVLAAVAETPEAASGVVSAFGWAPAQQLQGVVSSLLSDPSPHRRRIALAACAIHRANAGTYLETALKDDDPLLRARALKAVGELGAHTLLPQVQIQLSSDDESCRFWSAWSAVLLGDRAALSALKTFVNFKTGYCEPALQVALRVMDSASAQNWLKGLAQDEEQFRLALVGAGISGDPLYIPVLIKHMEQEDLACVAGEAFSMITGVDIALENLELSSDSEDTGQEDDDVSLDPDEGLPSPDPEKILSWWNENKSRFKPGERYFVGKPVTREHCYEVLHTGYQRQRTAAAIELALSAPGEPLFETRAPGLRQQAALNKA